MSLIDTTTECEKGPTRNNFIEKIGLDDGRDRLPPPMHATLLLQKHVPHDVTTLGARLRKLAAGPQHALLLDVGHFLKKISRVGEMVGGGSLSMRPWSSPKRPPHHVIIERICVKRIAYGILLSIITMWGCLLKDGGDDEPTWATRICPLVSPLLDQEFPSFASSPSLSEALVAFA